MDGHYSNNNQQQQQQKQLLFGSHHSVADIPLDQVAGGASFGDDFDLHRSVGGVATLRPAPVHFRRSIGGSPHHGGPHFGGYQQQHAALASVAGLAPPKFTSTSSSSVSNKPPAPPAYARGAPVAETAAAAPAEWEEAAVVVPELPPFDGFLEANDHVYLDGAQGVGAVARLLEACFRRQRVDWSFKPGKCKWKAACVRLRGGSGGGGVVVGHHHSLGLGPASPAPLGWPLLPAHPIQHQERRVGGGAQGASVDFRCRVYKADADGARLVLEFQRRQGDYFLMRDAFEAFLAAAAAAGLVLKEPPSTTAAATAPAWCVQQQSSSSVEFVSGGATTFNGGAGHGMMPSAAGFSRSSTTTTTTTVTSSGASSVTTVTSSSSSSFFAASASSSSKEQQQAARRMELEALAPLVAMAQAECRHENLEAAQALARLSASEDNRTLLAQNGQAIPALVALVGRTVCPEVQRAVVAALSNLSESASCKSPLVAAGAVTRLVRLVCGEEAGPAGAGAAAAVPYRLLETRRESARTLANLSEEHAAAIIREAGREQVVDLMRRVDELRDERLRMHARRLKARVGVCC